VAPGGASVSWHAAAAAHSMPAGNPWAWPQRQQMSASAVVGEQPTTIAEEGLHNGGGVGGGIGGGPSDLGGYKVSARRRRDASSHRSKAGVFVRRLSVWARGCSGKTAGFA